MRRRYPKYDNRNCQHCLKWFYIEETGYPDTLPDGETLVERLPCQPPLCKTKEGCPKGTPENPKTLNIWNELCLEYLVGHRVSGIPLPDDSVIVRNASIVEGINTTIDRSDRERFEKRLLNKIDAIG